MTPDPLLDGFDRPRGCLGALLVVTGSALALIAWGPGDALVVAFLGLFARAVARVYRAQRTDELERFERARAALRRSTR